MNGVITEATQRLLDTIREVTGHDVVFVAEGEKAGSPDLTLPVVSEGGARHGTLEISGCVGGLDEAHHGLYTQLTQIIAHEIELREQNLSLEHRFRLLDRQNAELAALNRALSEMAYRDPLTRLYQRWYLLEQLRLEATRSQRSRKDFSVLLVDIDSFEEINERYGQAGGDAVLRAVARTLEQSCRTSDVVCRFGGDEFAILLSDTPAGGAQEVASRICRRLREEKHPYGDTEIPITCSIGGASFLDAPERPLEALVEEVTRANHRAKKRGGDCFEFVAATEEVSGLGSQVSGLT